MDEVPDLFLCFIDHLVLILNKLDAKFEYRLPHNSLNDLHEVEFVSDLMTKVVAENLKIRLQQHLPMNSTELRVVESRTNQGQYRVVFYDPVSTHFLLKAMQSLLDETLFSSSSLKAQTVYDSRRGLYWSYNWGLVEYRPALFTSSIHESERNY